MKVVRFHAITPGAILSAAIRHVKAQWRDGQFEDKTAYDAIQILDQARDLFYAERRKRDWDRWQKNLQEREN